jgi:hypothetical protein
MSPTKEGLLSDDKIVSNLHEQISGPGLWESAKTTGMVRGISSAVVLIAPLFIAIPRVKYDGR